MLKKFEVKMNDINKTEIMNKSENRNKVCPNRTKHWQNRTRLWLD